MLFWIKIKKLKHKNIKFSSFLFQNSYWPFEDSRPHHYDQNLASTSSLFHPYVRPEVHSSPSEVHPVFARQLATSGFEDFGSGKTYPTDDISGETDHLVSTRQSPFSNFEDSEKSLEPQTGNGIAFQTSFEDSAFGSGSGPQAGYGSPVSGQTVKIKILPLPIPIGLPVQVNFQFRVRYFFNFKLLMISYLSSNMFLTNFLFRQCGFDNQVFL